LANDTVSTATQGFSWGEGRASFVAVSGGRFKEATK